MKKVLLVLVLATTMFVLKAQDKKAYLSGGAEVIFSQADVSYNAADVNTLLRFTVWFHIQQHINYDINKNFGLFGGLSVRNIGIIMEDDLESMGFQEGTSKTKHRVQTLGFPVGIKIGNFDENLFFYAGGEYEWAWRYRQKAFIYGEKYSKFAWGSPGVTNWLPSVFAGVQLPAGINLKFKYYLGDFFTPNQGIYTWDQNVDYSNFDTSGIWYISLAIMINRRQIQNMTQGYNKTASR